MASGKKRLIEEAKARVEELLEERIDEQGMTLDEIEAVVERTTREVAAWILERLVQEQQPPKANRAACPQCATLGKYKRRLDAQVLTIHGPLQIRRRYHYCAVCERGFAPIDAALGLAAGRDATRRVRFWQAKYGSESAFAAVPELLQDLRGITVSASTVERTTLEVGAQLRTSEPTWMPPPPAGKAPAASPRLYLSLDGTMCPLRDEWCRDGSRGKLVCRYGEAKLGIVFQTGSQDGLDTGVVRRGCVGTMGELREFRPLVLELGRQWRLREARELIVLGDGAVWIWLLAGAYYAHAVQILDFWHMTDHLWKVAHARFGKGTEAGKAWVQAAQWDLKRDLTASFLQGLRDWAPTTEAAQEVQRVELAYFEENAPRMKYGTYLAKGYMIGSGVMESACRQVVTQRLDQAGMHWRKETAGAVLAIRAHLRSTGAPPLAQYA
jgi:hypothetical protein